MDMKKFAAILLFILMFSIVALAANVVSAAPGGCDPQDLSVQRETKVYEDGTVEDYTAVGCHDEATGQFQGLVTNHFRFPDGTRTNWLQDCAPGVCEYPVAGVGNSNRQNR